MIDPAMVVISVGVFFGLEDLALRLRGREIPAAVWLRSRLGIA